MGQGCILLNALRETLYSLCHISLKQTFSVSKYIGRYLRLCSTGLRKPDAPQ